MNDLEDEPLHIRLRTDPGHVHPVSAHVLLDGRRMFTAAVDCMPPGLAWQVESRDYPRIVGVLKAHGFRVRPDSVLTLVSAREVDG